MVKKVLLVIGFLLPLVVCRGSMADFWVNELNYQSSPNIEIVRSPSSAGANLSTVILSLYDGSTGTVYASHALSTFTVGATVNNYTLYSLTGFTIQTGGPSGGPDIPDGWAISVAGTVAEFKSYEGTFTAVSGVAAGLTSTDIGVRQEQGYPAQSSSQLTGTGTASASFNWISGQGPSYGQVNLSQTLVAVPEPSSIVLLGLVAGAIFLRRKR